MDSSREPIPEASPPPIQPAFTPSIPEAPVIRSSDVLSLLYRNLEPATRSIPTQASTLAHLPLVYLAPECLSVKPPGLLGNTCMRTTVYCRTNGAIRKRKCLNTTKQTCNPKLLRSYDSAGPKNVCGTVVPT
ncbi:unnamed protein product [Ectocarpus sp. 12 AP-2014]